MRKPLFVFLRAALLAAFFFAASARAATNLAAPPPLPPPADVNTFFTPPYQLTAAQPPFTLRSVFRRLAKSEGGQRTFTETRKFAISKNPVRTNGTLRYGRRVGLSIAYDGTPGRILVIDDQGLIERIPGGGRERSISVNDRPELAALTDVYLNLLRGNSAKLFAASNAYYAGERGTGWQLGLVPKDEGIAKRIGRAVVYGRGRDITRIDTISPSGETRSLDLGPLKNNVRFSPEEMKAYFRGE